MPNLHFLHITLFTQARKRTTRCQTMGPVVSNYHISYTFEKYNTFHREMSHFIERHFERIFSHVVIRDFSQIDDASAVEQ